MNLARSPLLLPRFIWSPTPPLAGAIILALAATAPIYAVAQLVPAMLALPLALSITSLVLWSSSSLFDSHDGAMPTRLDAVRQFSGTTGRKSIYDLETGFCADWYFMLRVEEEIARTARSGQSFGLLCVEPRQQLGATMRNHLLLALERSFRTADLVGRLGDVRFGVLLPDSDDIGTSAARGRIQQLFGRKVVEVRATVHPHGDEDWRTFFSQDVAAARFPSSEPIWTPEETSAFDRGDRSA